MAPSLDEAVSLAKTRMQGHVFVLAQPHGVLLDDGARTVVVVEAGYDLEKSGVRSRESVVWLGGQSPRLTESMVRPGRRFEVSVVSNDQVHRFPALLASAAPKSGQLALVPRPVIDWETLDTIRPVPPRGLEDPAQWLSLLDRHRTRSALWSLWRQWVGLLAHEPDGPLLPAFLQLAETAPVCQQNLLIARSRAEESGLPAVFYVENQACCFWTVDGGDDGTVYWHDGAPSDGAPGSRGTPQGKLVDFLVQLVVFEQSMGAGCGVGGLVEEAMLNDVLAPFRELPLPPWSWPTPNTRFFAAPGMLAYTSPQDDEVGLWVGAKTPWPLRHFRSFDIDWDVIDA